MGVKVLVAQSYPTPCDPMDTSPPGFLTQELNPGQLHCRQILNHLSHECVQHQVFKKKKKKGGYKYITEIEINKGRILFDFVEVFIILVTKLEEISST